MGKDKKNKAAGIKAAMTALEKRYGEPVLMKMSEANMNVDTFSSGRADLDVKLGGGYAVGKVIEIYAPSGAGKTGLALEAIASIQRGGGVAAIIDAEHALNTEYCEQIGVNANELLLVQPNCGEQAFEAIKYIIHKAEVDLIVVDSVASLTPLAIIEGEVGEAKMAAHARLMGQGLKSITGIADEVGCTIIFINQLREKIVMYGNPETTTGGNALKFYASQRLDIRNKGWIKEGEDIIGFKQKIKIVKNKIAPPFKNIENDIIYGKGVDDMTGLIDACVNKGIIEKNGSYFKFDGANLAQGMKKLRIVLEENPDIVDILKKKAK